MRTMNIGIVVATVTLLASAAFAEYDEERKYDDEKREAAERNAPVIIVEDGAVVLPSGQVLRKETGKEDEVADQRPSDEP